MEGSGKHPDHHGLWWQSSGALSLGDGAECGLHTRAPTAVFWSTCVHTAPGTASRSHPAAPGCGVPSTRSPPCCVPSLSSSLASTPIPPYCTKACFSPCCPSSLEGKPRTPLSSRVVHGVSGHLSSCIWNLQLLLVMILSYLCLLSPSVFRTNMPCWM